MASLVAATAALPQGPAHRASLWYLKERELYKTVKPYRLRFDSPDPEVARGNTVFEEIKNVSVQDVRDQLPIDFEKRGFGFASLDCRLSFEDCEDRTLVEQAYLRPLKPVLADFFGTPHIIMLEHTTRRRQTVFPVSTGDDYENNQPVMVVHIDWTKDEATAKILAAMGEERGRKILSGRWQYVHVWKPLNGPTKDWPLAFCDASTVNPTTDLEACDSVNNDANYNAEETFQVYHRPCHRWYYLRDQKNSDLAIFRQHDSKLGQGSGVPHVAFQDPSASTHEVPRESVELQVVVYYDE